MLVLKIFSDEEIFLFIKQCMMLKLLIILNVIVLKIKKKSSNLHAKTKYLFIINLIFKKNNSIKALI
jgi:hypothetical protein